jgi:hypothetical protein
MDDAPFRRPGQGVSPVLSQLASAGEERRRELPREAELTPPDRRSARLEQVFGVAGNNASGLGLLALLVWTLLLPICGVITNVDGNPAPAIIGTLCAIAATVWALTASDKRRAQRRAAVAEQLARVEKLPFPVRGYDKWCLSERPLFDLTLSAPIERRQLIDAVAAIDSTVEVEWLDERTARFFIPPRAVEAAEGPTSWYADPTALTRLFDQLFLPLHSDVPIESIEMGGAMFKR